MSQGAIASQPAQQMAISYQFVTKSGYLSPCYRSSVDFNPSQLALDGSFMKSWELVWDQFNNLNVYRLSFKMNKALLNNAPNVSSSNTLFTVMYALGGSTSSVDFYPSFVNAGLGSDDKSRVFLQIDEAEIAGVLPPGALVTGFTLSPIGGGAMFYDSFGDSLSLPQIFF
jgi:hypothetical protein